MPEPGATEAELWRAIGVDLMRAPLEPYLDGLGRTVAAGVGANT
jgi:hypothetical protein